MGIRKLILDVLSCERKDSPFVQRSGKLYVTGDTFSVEILKKGKGVKVELLHRGESVYVRTFSTVLTKPGDVIHLSAAAIAIEVAVKPGESCEPSM